MRMSDTPPMMQPDVADLAIACDPTKTHDIGQTAVNAVIAWRQAL